MDGICELTLETTDLDTLTSFYTEVIGLSFLSGEGDRVWLECGPNTRLGLWSPGDKEFGDEGGRHVHFAFSVDPDALDELAERLRSHHREFRGPVDHEGGDRSLYFKDPAGNLVEAWDFFNRGAGGRDGVDALR